jgi:hypothetical protein
MNFVPTNTTPTVLAIPSKDSGSACSHPIQRRIQHEMVVAEVDGNPEVAAIEVDEKIPAAGNFLAGTNVTASGFCVFLSAIRPRDHSFVH